MIVITLMVVEMEINFNLSTEHIEHLSIPLQASVAKFFDSHNFNCDCDLMK